MEVNGSPAPVLETDDQCTYFLTVLPVHEHASVEVCVGGVEVSDIASSMATILRYCSEPRTRNELLKRLGFAAHTRNYNRYILPGI